MMGKNQRGKPIILREANTEYRADYADWRKKLGGGLG
jgi:hypothetical protein